LAKQLYGNNDHENNYYIERAYAFSPEWVIEFNVAPVAINSLVDWFK